jgi:hypothetical protein
MANQKGGISRKGTPGHYDYCIFACPHTDTHSSLERRITVWSEFRNSPGSTNYQETIYAEQKVYVE